MSNSVVKPVSIIGLPGLAEDHELPGGAASLGPPSETAHLHWAHLAVSDYRAPDHAFADKWHDLELLYRLASGENWAIHCRAGLGRTGTIAAKLLIEAGYEPADAIATIRSEHATRAIDTKVQIDYLFGFAQMATRTRLLSGSSIDQ